VKRGIRGGGGSRAVVAGICDCDSPRADLPRALWWWKFDVVAVAVPEAAGEVEVTAVVGKCPFGSVTLVPRDVASAAVSSMKCCCWCRCIGATRHAGKTRRR